MKNPESLVGRFLTRNLMTVENTYGSEFNINVGEVMGMLSALFSLKFKEKPLRTALLATSTLLLLYSAVKSHPFDKGEDSLIRI